jgi:hypothetical protein
MDPVIVCNPSEKREAHHGAAGEFVASYAYGKQKRTATREKETETSESSAWQLQPTHSAHHSRSASEKLVVSSFQRPP